MCCKVLGIGADFRGAPFKKPAGQWCPHCKVGQGCAVYEERPTICRDFECLYLLGVKRGEAMFLDHPELRPDRCGVCVTPTTDGHLACSVDRHKPDAWKQGRIKEQIRAWVRAGIRVTISTAYSEKKLVLTRRGDRIAVSEMAFTTDDDTGMQWSVPGTDRLIGWLD
jgi:hypothetical protein